MSSILPTYIPSSKNGCKVYNVSMLASAKICKSLLMMGVLLSTINGAESKENRPVPDLEQISSNGTISGAKCVERHFDASEKYMACVHAC